MVLLKFGLGLGFRRGTEEAFTVSLQLLRQLNTLDKTGRCVREQSCPSSPLIDSHCLIINYGSYTRILQYWKWSSKKIRVNYRGAIILTGHIFTSGFVRSDTQIGVYMPQGELSGFRVPILKKSQFYPKYPEKSHTYWSLYFMSVTQKTSSNRGLYLSSTFGQTDFSQEFKELLKNLTQQAQTNFKKPYNANNTGL